MGNINANAIALKSQPWRHAAWGLEAGVRLIEYRGVRYPKDEVPGLGDDGVTRFLRFSDGTGIDGTGWAALANHGRPRPARRGTLN